MRTDERGGYARVVLALIVGIVLGLAIGMTRFGWVGREEPLGAAGERDGEADVGLDQGVDQSVDQGVDPATPTAEGLSDEELAAGEEAAMDAGEDLPIEDGAPSAPVPTPDPAGVSDRAAPPSPGPATTTSAATSATPAAGAALSREPQTGEPMPVIELGEAELSPLAGATARGHVRFTIEGGDLRIVAHVTGASPGDHALVIHNGATCVDRDGNVAVGTHLDPFGSPHGMPNTAASHVGDLGNVAVGSDGRGELAYFMERAHYPIDDRGGWRILLEKPVALHAARDDFATQPDGGAGVAIACGKIVPVEAAAPAP